MATLRAAPTPKPIEIDKFLGLNESIGDTEVKLGEAIYMRNFRITPNFKLEKRKGHTTFIDESQLTKPIQGMWYGTIGSTQVLIYACNGSVKRKVMPSGATTVLGAMTDAKTNMFYFNGKVFFQNGVEYKYYDGTTFADVSTIAYVPTLTIATPPTGGGTLFEEINQLTPKKKQKFLGNGTATLYQLAETNIDATLLIVTVNGAVKTETTDFTVNRTLGQVTFIAAPANLSDVIIQWEKASSSVPSLVLNNRFSVIYGVGNGTTVFMWGNTTAKNRRTFSGVLDATYFPANNYTLIGSDEFAITDMQPQQGTLIIFKEDKTYRSNPEYIATLNRYDYPVFDLNYAVGNNNYDGVRVLNDKPVSLYKSNVYMWDLTYTESERSARNISEKMTVSFTDIDFSNAVTFDYQKEQEFWINVGNDVYIYNYDNDAWYIYDNIEATCFLEVENKVYYGTKNGKIERFEGFRSDNGIAINAIWKSGFTDFGAYEFYKNSTYLFYTIQPFTNTSVSIKCPTNRKNEGDPTLKVFTDGYSIFGFDSIDFTDFTFGTARNPQAFREKIKAKKYAYIQFIFFNNELNEDLVFLSFKVQCETTSLIK